VDIIVNLSLGFATAVTPANLLYCFVGALLGTLIGVLPGLGPTATIAMLLPLTFSLPPVSALIMLSGIYYGAQYGGSTTAILVNLPGETSSIVTALDGYQMARRGAAGKALAAAAIASFIAGTISTCIVAFFAPVLAEVALKFGPTEYFALMVLGLVMAIVLAQGSVLHAVGMALIGLALGTVGTDVTSGVARFAFGIPELSDGIGFVGLSMGVFGICEIVRNLEGPQHAASAVTSIGGMMLDRQEFRRLLPSALRGTALGSILGILPGGGATLASFASYALEKKVSRNSAQFGHGAMEGVAGPEAANNAGAQTSFIPMLTLGIPSNPVMALMIGALIIQGIQPGPSVISEQPALFWGIIVSMWIGNVLLVVLNLPMVGLWARLITVRYTLLYPAILAFCAIGVFTANNSEFDIHLMALFGVFGYLLAKADCEPAPMLLGFILGPMMEEYLRRAMQLSTGNPLVFVTRPISAIMLAIAAISLVVILSPAVRRKRQEAFQE
jgi:TctA family transporter